jgi:hypothetical protein
MPNTVKCPSCGGAVPLPEGRDSGFCPNCGAKVSAPAQAAANWAGAPERSEYSFGDPFESPAPQLGAANDYGQYASAAQKKKMAWRPSPKLIIIAAAVVAVAAAGVFFVLPALGGGAYQKAEVAFIQGIVTKVPLAGDEGRQIEFDVAYEASDDTEYYLEIAELALSGELSYAGQAAAASLTLDAYGETTDIEAAFDGNELTLSLPDITRYYIRYMLGGDSGADTIDFSSLDQKKLEATLTAVAKEYFRVTDEAADVEKGVTLSGGAASVKCDKYTIDFTQDILAQIGLAAIKELRANDNLMEFICGLALQANSYYYEDYDIDDMMDEFEDMLDEVEEGLEDMDGDDRLFRMAVWIKGGEVVARKIDKIQGSGAVISYQDILTKNARNIEIEVKDGNSSISFKGDFEKNGGAWSGTPKFAMSSYYGEVVSLKAKFSNIKFSGKQVTGDINVTGTFEDGEGMCDLDITLGKSGDKQTIEIEGEVGDDYDTLDIGVLSLSYSSKAVSRVSGSGPSNANYGVTVGDYSDDNLDRAADMSEELEELRYSEYDGNEFMQELLYAFEEAVDNIIWNSRYYNEDWYNNY